MLKSLTGASLIALSLTGGLRAQEMVYPDTMVVLDVSNSMWGQIDGVSKMQIARGVIGDLLGDLETESDFGLIAYGHRQTNSCDDIELILPIAPLDGAAFSEAVNRLQPRGRTPLTAAIAMAAQEMDSENRSARIILLTDGLESCGADPCALAAQLEESGLDFTAHVIGFGVGEIEDQSQLKCLAENTGGVYLTAETADELTSALHFMAAPDGQPKITLTALDSDGNTLDNAEITWSIFNMTDQEMWLRDESGASVSVEYQADDYRATAMLGDQMAEVDFYFDGENNATFNVVFDTAETGETIEPTQIVEIVETTETAETPEIIETAVASLDAPNAILPGQEISVPWVGPSNSGDYLAIALPDDVVTTFNDYARTRKGSPAILTAPDAPGIYEIRYISPTTNEILATDMIIIGEIEITLEAPERVATDSTFSISWDGPLFEGDTVALVSAGDDIAEALVSLPASSDQTASFTAPSDVGAFEIRYLDAGGKTLQTAEIKVTYAATLEAAPVIVAGSSMLIEWTGPNLNNDFIAVVPVGFEGTVFGSFSYTRDGRQVKILTSDTPGAYEVRYILGVDDSVLASLPLTLAKPDVSITAPAEALTGATITLNWVGPNNQNDYLTVVPENASEGASINYTFTRQGSPVNVELPIEPGDFEIRYVTGQSGITLYRAKISLTREPTVLSAEETAVAGSTIAVSWHGPESDDDLITIVPVGTPDEDFGNFTYTREGNNLGVISEDNLGAYELRYVSGSNNAILARLPITLVAPPVIVSAQTSAVAGQTIEVEWFGPDDDNDYVTIVPLGTDEGEYGNYTYTRNGTPLELITKDLAGEYEIRYVSGEERLTLARAPITLIAPDASVDTVPQAIAGAEITVAWRGPDNPNDFITIVPAGTPPSDYGNYTYTNRGNDLLVLTPDMPGNYEVRYLSGQSYVLLASIPITLSPPDITLDAFPVGVVGTVLEIEWTGPSHKNDFLTIVPVGADDTALGTYQYTRKGNPLDIQLPNEPGAYEIRYVSGQSMRSLQALPLTILAQ